MENVPFEMIEEIDEYLEFFNKPVNDIKKRWLGFFLQHREITNCMHNIRWIFSAKKMTENIS